MEISKKFRKNQDRSLNLENKENLKLLDQSDKKDRTPRTQRDQVLIKRTLNKQNKQKAYHSQLDTLRMTSLNI